MLGLLSDTAPAGAAAAARLMLDPRCHRASLSGGRMDFFYTFFLKSLCIFFLIAKVQWSHFLFDQFVEIWEVLSQDLCSNGERNGKVGWKNLCIFFLSQGDNDVTSGCFHDIKQMQWIPSEIHDAIKSSSMTEDDFKSIIGYT